MRTSRGLDRLITFLDAVVAIAITLLVLPLVDVVDVGGGAAAHRSLTGVVADNAGSFRAFLLSFVVIAGLWLSHHRILERVGAYDTAFLWVNLAWVLTIVVLPFASQVTAVYDSHTRGAVATYIGTVAASSACLSVLALLVERRPALRRDGVDPGSAGALGSLVITGLLLVALVVGVTAPRVNYGAMLVLLLSRPVERVLQRLLGRAGG